MARLYLVRHALTRPDPAQPAAGWALDPAGSADLARMASLPHWGGVGRIVSSPEPKALLTAEAIRSRHELPPAATFDDLREIHKAGWTDRHDEVMAEFFREPGRPALPGWETASDALARFSACVDWLVAKGGDLILVSHGVVLSLYLADLLGQSHVRYDDWRSIRMPDFALVNAAERRVVQPFGAW